MPERLGEALGFISGVILTVFGLGVSTQRQRGKIAGNSVDIDNLKKGKVDQPAFDSHVLSCHAQQTLVMAAFDRRFLDLKDDIAGVRHLTERILLQNASDHAHQREGD